jgi:hypothetical protein
MQVWSAGTGKGTSDQPNKRRIIMKKDIEKKAPKKDPGTEATTGPGCDEDENEGPTAEVRLLLDVHAFIRQNFGDEAVHVESERLDRLCSLAERLGGLEKPLVQVLADRAKDAQFRMVVGKVVKERTVLEAGLDRGFARLADDGYLVAQRAGCCRSCAKPGLERMARKTNVIPEGYVFYSGEDGCQMDKEGSVYVAYGITCPQVYEEGVRKVGAHAAEVLRRAGLIVEWDGWHRTALLLKPQPSAQEP